ncbi:uncharacterized protein LOC118741784 [Rhagoletis pomonella]|uniref:uncharacterized protein LOC118741784 n=1 Tax=Rhagoletis pomonella TaxID=28610 RepID=UPI00177E4715|nr:uncharacterized protein LOC118741784 [Rhagoletis pomonella]
MKAEWSKAFIIRPRDNLQSHVYIKQKKFVPSYENDPCPVPMNWLMGWEYARIWLRERDDYICERLRKSKAKRIKNDYTGWLAKRQIKPKKVS